MRSRGSGCEWREGAVAVVLLLVLVVMMGGVVRHHRKRSRGNAGLDREQPAPFRRHPARGDRKANE